MFTTKFEMQGLPPQDFELPVSDIEDWIERKRKQGDQTEPGERIHFTEAEAEGKIGCIIRSVIEFRGVPEGTRGKVIRADAVKVGKFSVGIEWELPVSGKPLVDWFSKDDYEQYLLEE